jgi:hypothetical protein
LLDPDGIVFFRDQVPRQGATNTAAAWKAALQKTQGRLFSARQRHNASLLRER